jgi:hypothetical protein
MKSSMSFTANGRDFLKKIAVVSTVGLLLSACMTMGATRVSSGPLYSAIKVDVEPVRAKNIGAYADKIGFYQNQALLDAYTGSVATTKSLPVLTVEIHSIYFGENASSDFEVNTPFIMRQSTRTSDTLEGIAVIRQGGKEIRHQKILAVHISTDHGQWSMADDEKRLIELTQFFAFRLRQELGD